MRLPKIFIALAIILFGTIATMAFFKHSHKADIKLGGAVSEPTIVQLALDHSGQSKSTASIINVETSLDTNLVPLLNNPIELEQAPIISTSDKSPPEADRIAELFSTDTTSQLSIVQTISYNPKVSWLKGRPAWVVDYARHYATSRHFIARSLNHGKPNYLSQTAKKGDKFNVLRTDKSITFHLLVDISRCKMWFYYLDRDSQERVLLKTYRVGLGRVTNERKSGLLTPIGKYSLGSRIATFEPKMKGPYNGQQVELIRVFGTRWIPFAQELENCTEPAKGYGIHGMPWGEDPATNTLIENASSLGQYQSDGCIRMRQVDVEELYSIIVTRPTTIEIVKDFYDAQLPGNEQTVSVLAAAHN